MTSGQRLAFGCLVGGVLMLLAHPRSRPMMFYAFQPDEARGVLAANPLSTAGASILALGFLLPLTYLTYSVFRGRVAGPNPWGAYGLEWETSSPPPTTNS